MMPHRRQPSDDPIWSRRSNSGIGVSYDDRDRHSRPPHAGADRRSTGERAATFRPRTTTPGEPTQTTIIQSTVKPVADSEIYKVGIYGWRKRCLYVFILILTLIIIVNLILTIWIMVVLNFSTDGLGALKITSDGIRVTGKTKFEKPVQFSRIATENNEALTLESALGVALNAHNLSGDITSSLDVSTTGKVTASCERFEVRDRGNKLLFFADSNEVGLKLDSLRILDDGGSIFEGAIQTSMIRPDSDSTLSLESPTRSIRMDAGQDIELLSQAGEFSLTTLLDVNVTSKQGDIRFEGNVYLTGLEQSHGRGVAQYQLCVCQNGRLFMAAESADCRADRNICED